MEGGGEGAAKVGLLVDEMSAWMAAGERDDRGTTVPQITTDIACRHEFDVHTEVGIVKKGQAEEVRCQRGTRFEFNELRSILKPLDDGISKIKCQVGVQEAFGHHISDSCSPQRPAHLKVAPYDQVVRDDFMRKGVDRASNHVRRGHQRVKGRRL